MYDAMIAAGAARRPLRGLTDPTRSAAGRSGPMMIDGFTSGVGKDAIVQQHGMTVGELARYFNGEFLPAAGGDGRDLRRDRWRGLADATSCSPTPACPGSCPAPTCRPRHRAPLPRHRPVRGDQPVGGPRHDPAVRADRRHRTSTTAGPTDLTRRSCRGVEFREAYFTPTFSKHVGVVCGGVQVHVTDPAKFDAIAVATQMIVSLRRPLRRVRLAHRGQPAGTVDRQAHRLQPLRAPRSTAALPRTRSWPRGRASWRSSTGGDARTCSTGGHASGCDRRFVEGVRCPGACIARPTRKRYRVVSRPRRTQRVRAWAPDTPTSSGRAAAPAVDWPSSGSRPR